MIKAFDRNTALVANIGIPEDIARENTVFAKFFAKYISATGKFLITHDIAYIT